MILFECRLCLKVLRNSCLSLVVVILCMCSRLMNSEWKVFRFCLLVECSGIMVRLSGIDVCLLISRWCSFFGFIL